MENTKSDAIAGGDKPADESLSMEDLVGLWSEKAKETEEPEIPEEETEEEPAEEPEAEVADEPEEEDAEEQPEGIDGIDLASLTDEQWEVVRTKLKSRAAADIQALKRENRAKDETIAALQSQSQQQPAAPKKPVTSRFLEGVENTDQLTGKVEELKGLTKSIKKALRAHADYGMNEPFQIDGETFTRAGLEDLRDEVEEALTEAAPSKQAEIAAIAASEQMLESAKAEALARVPALADEKSEVSKTFNTLLESPNFKEAYETFPKLRPMLHLLGALAVEKVIEGSKANGVKAPVTTGAKPKAKPPGTPSGVAVVPTPKSEAKNKQIEAARARYEASGTQEDLVKLWALQKSGG